MRYLVVIVLALTLSALPARGLVAEPSAFSGADLVSGDAALDGITVRLEGEVISERLNGGDGHVWVNVLFDGTGIGVWMPREMADDIEVLGDWQHVGDTVGVTGVFHLACNQHGGDLDIHATDVELLERGSERQRPVAYWKLGMAAAGALVAYLGYRRMRRAEESRIDD